MAGFCTAFFRNGQNHGRICSRNVKSVPFMYLGISVNRYFRQTPLLQAVQKAHEKLVTGEGMPFTPPDAGEMHRTLASGAV